MRQRLCILMTMMALLVSCDEVDKDERLIYVKPAQVERNILLEDFTGQRCVNCPAAARQIELLQEQYGSDAVIAVAIHSGPLGFAGNESNVGLLTQLGNRYFQFWEVEYQPAGVVNRNGTVLNYTDWQKKVYDELQKTASLSLSLDNQFDEGSRLLTIRMTATGTDGATSGKLQLWLVEDNITAMQIRYNDVSDASSGQITDREYLHQHVLRDAVNGTWGDDFTIAEGETRQLEYTYVVPESWKAADVSVVAFVYNGVGVEQVTKKKIE